MTRSVRQRYGLWRVNTLLQSSSQIYWLREVPLFAARWRSSAIPVETMSFLQDFLKTDSFPQHFDHHGHQILHLQMRVFARNPTTIEELKQRITDEINAIPCILLYRVFHICSRGTVCARRS